MSDNPFDRVITNPLEKPLSKDLNRQYSELDRSIRFFAKHLFSSTGVAVSGFLQDSFKVNESSPQAMSVVLKAGLGFQDTPADVPSDIGGIVGLNDLESYKPLPLLADITLPIATAPVGPNTRIDIIEVRADRLSTDSQSRDIFDNVAEVFNPTAVDKTLEFLLDGTKVATVVSPADSVAAIGIKQGVEGTPGVVPTVSPGYIKIAEVAVGSGVSVITTANITDTRTQLVDAIRGPAVKEILIPAAACEYQVGGGGVATHNVGLWFSSTGNNFQISVPISGYLKTGDRILSITAHLLDAVGNVVSCNLYEQAMPGTALVAISNVDTSDNTGTAQSVPLTGISFNGATNVLETGKTYHAKVERLAAPNFIQFYGMSVTFDTPPV